MPPQRPSASQITQDYIAETRRIGASVQRDILTIWRNVDPSNIDAAWSLVSPIVANTVTAGWTTTQHAAASYLSTLARHEGVVGLSAVLGQGINTEQLATALRVTGPIAFKQSLANGLNFTEATQTSGIRLAGSGQRLALAGGRSTIENTIALAQQVRGWRRVAGDANPCAFCAMLISRGAVYSSAASASRVIGRQVFNQTAKAPDVVDAPRYEARGSSPLGQKYHDHCHCTVQPLFEEQDDPADVVKLRDLWNDSTADTYGSGQTQFQRFRQAYESQAS